ncbi:possible pectin degradation protein [Flavobacteriales bacterium ALC-1]|nr:possible pectin degradation protein [Flavobacteriales bacterium ALC-1]
MSLEYVISEIEPREIIKGYRARFIHSETMTVAIWEIDAGAKLPEHSHINEQLVRLTEGQFEMTIDGVTKIYTPGSILVIPPNVSHSGKAITDCKITDTFSPVREDYK